MIRPSSLMLWTQLWWKTELSPKATAMSWPLRISQWWIEMRSARASEEIQCAAGVVPEEVPHDRSPGRRPEPVFVLAVAAEEPGGEAAVDLAVLELDVLVEFLGVVALVLEADRATGRPDGEVVKADTGAVAEPDGVG